LASLCKQVVREPGLRCRQNSRHHRTSSVQQLYCTEVCAEEVGPGVGLGLAFYYLEITTSDHDEDRAFAISKVMNRSRLHSINFSAPNKPSIKFPPALGHRCCVDWVKPVDFRTTEQNSAFLPFFVRFNKDFGKNSDSLCRLSTNSRAQRRGQFCCSAGDLYCIALQFYFSLFH
jgi:beta-xylosidase